MKLPSLFASLVIGFTLHACALPGFAQHGGGGHAGGGGFSGHGGGVASSGGFHSGGSSGFSSRVASGFRPGANSGFHSQVNSPLANRAGYGYVRNSIPMSQRFANYRSSQNPSRNGNYRGGYRTDPSRPAYSGVRNGYGGADRRGLRDRNRYGYGYGSGYGYGGYPLLGIPFLGYYGSDFFDYPDDSYDNSASPTNYVTEDYPGRFADQPQDYDPNEANEPTTPYGSQSSGYQPYPQNYYPTQSVAPPLEQPTVTLVLKDGRQRQIRNYILSRDTLTVLDARQIQIPVGEIDLAATEKLNRESGVNFRLPSR